MTAGEQRSLTCLCAECSEGANTKVALSGNESPASTSGGAASIYALDPQRNTHHGTTLRERRSVVCRPPPIPAGDARPVQCRPRVRALDEGGLRLFGMAAGNAGPHDRLLAAVA